MSRPKDPTRYPAFLRASIEKLDRKPSTPIVFDCNDRAEARNLQLMFNCFKKAALDAGWGKIEYPTLGVIAARIKEEDGKYSVSLFNLEGDPAIQRWGRVVGVEPVEDLPDDDQPAYAGR